MRCFRIDESGVGPIPVEGEPYPHVVVGEPTRRTRSTWVPLAPGFATAHGAAPLEEAYLTLARKNERVLISEAREPHQEALLQLAVAPGADGAVRYTSADYVERECPLQGQVLGYHDVGPVPPRIETMLMPMQEACVWCGAVVERDDDAELWLHPERGVRREWGPLPLGPQPDPSAGWLQMVAEGTRVVPGKVAHAYTEMLVVAHPPVEVRAARYGRIGPVARHEAAVHWDGSGLTVRAIPRE